VSFRNRLALVAAAAVAVAVVAASIAIYLSVRSELIGEVDGSLADLADHVKVTRAGAHVDVYLPPPTLGGAGGYVQLVDPSGNTYLPRGSETFLPVSERDRAVAAGALPATTARAACRGCTCGS
jgi:hypothetical protein